MAAHHLAEVGVIVVAAGRGERLGARTPKAFVELGDQSLLERAIRTVTALPVTGQLVLVVPDTHADHALEIVDATVPAGAAWQVSVVAGGRERHESVRKGLEALGETIETVLVHDAARPLTPPAVFQQVIDAVHEHRVGVIPVVPVADTLKRLDAAGNVEATINREALAAAQTPQGFVREQLEAAHATAQARELTAPDNDAPTDDAEVLQRAGGTVRTVTGSPLAHKLTTPVDHALLTGLLMAHTRTGRTRVATSDLGDQR